MDPGQALRAFRDDTPEAPPQSHCLTLRQG
jgi:hypothetical protein